MVDPRTALEAIGQLPDAEIDLAEAALQFARVDVPAADYVAARLHLSTLAREAVQALPSDPPTDLTARAGVIWGVLVRRHHYAGDTDTYDDPANANLIRVIERKRGLPVALGILWLHCARAADLPAHGIDFPGHFMVAMDGGDTKLVLDVFGGGVPMDARDLRGLLKRVEGEAAELRPGMLIPMSNRAVLLRLQNNVKSRRLAGGDLTGALACAEDMLRVAPGEPALWREAALMNQRLDRVTAALGCFERFLEIVPDGEAATRVRSAMEELRSRLN